MFQLGCFFREHLLAPLEVVTIVDDLGIQSVLFGIFDPGANQIV
jgi:hypothetical protein